LEFLGDRVLGLVMAEWLSERFPKEPEGQLSHRFTTLVSRAKCAHVASEMDVADYLRMGKQAWQEGVSQSENVLGDTAEALIAALYLDGGLGEAKRFIRDHWRHLVESQGATAPRHPKSLLIEWAEGRGHKPPTYEMIGRSGPGHSLEFTVRVTVKGVGEAEGIGSSKQEAETAAAAALLERLK
jgi:ribonuclease-3